MLQTDSILPLRLCSGGAGHGALGVDVKIAGNLTSVIFVPFGRLIFCLSTCSGSEVVTTKHPMTYNTMCVYVASLPILSLRPAWGVLHSLLQLKFVLL